MLDFSRPNRSHCAISWRQDQLIGSDELEKPADQRRVESMWLNWPNCRQRKTRKTHNPITALCTIIGNFQSGHSRLLPAARTAGGKVEFRGKYDNFPLLLCWLPTAPQRHRIDFLRQRTWINWRDCHYCSESLLPYFFGGFSACFVVLRRYRHEGLDLAQETPLQRTLLWSKTNNLKPFIVGGSLLGSRVKVRLVWRSAWVEPCGDVFWCWFAIRQNLLASCCEICFSFSISLCS